jgi:tol-pal system protein YbgF
MKSLLAFAAGMLVGVLATLGWGLATRVDHAAPAAMERDGAGLAAAVRDAAGALDTALEAVFSPPPRDWSLRRPIERRLRMARNDVVLKLRFLPDVPADVAGSDRTATPPVQVAAPPPPAAAPGESGTRPAVPPVPRGAGAAAGEPIPEPVPPEAPERLYARALYSYENKRHDEARRLFARFLEAFPGHSLVPNALYWTGETWYDQARYDKAAESFAQVLKDHPRHAKSPDALLKLAYSALRQGRTEQARAYLDQLLARYPDSGASRLGRQARGRLQGSGRPGTMVANHG